MDTAQNHGGQIDAESQGGKLVIQVTLAAEEGDDLDREKLKGQGRHSPDDRLGQHHGPEDLAHPLMITGTVVITYDGLTSGSDAHHEGDDNLEDLYDDAHHGHGDVRPVLGLGAVLDQGGVHHPHDDDDGHLGEQAADAQGQEAGEQDFSRPEAVPAQAEGPAPAQIAQSQHCRDHLAEDGSPGRPRHPPVEDKDGDGVQNDVDDAPDQGREHGELGAAIGPDDGVEAVGEDEEGDADEDDVKIIHGVGQVVLRGPEGGQDAIPAQGEDRH